MSVLLQDANGNVIQTIRPGTKQNVTVGAASAATSNAVGTNTKIAMLISTTACWFNWGAAPTAAVDATSIYLPANTYFYLPVKGGTDKVAFIQAASGGTAQVIEGI